MKIKLPWRKNDYIEIQIDSMNLLSVIEPNQVSMEQSTEQALSRATGGL